VVIRFKAVTDRDLEKNTGAKTGSWVGTTFLKAVSIKEDTALIPPNLILLRWERHA